MALIKTVPTLDVVAEASDGKQAVALFRQHQPDVTLMDLRLPVMNGVEAITRSGTSFRRRASLSLLPLMVTKISTGRCRQGPADIC